MLFGTQWQTRWGKETGSEMWTQATTECLCLATHTRIHAHAHTHTHASTHTHTHTHTHDICIPSSHFPLPFLSPSPMCWTQNGMNILHCAAKRNHVAVVDFLKSKCFPPTHECKLVKNQLSKVCEQGQR